MHIENFTQWRDDGKAIPPSMTSLDVLDFGWMPARIVSITWACNGKKYEYSSPYGISSRVILGEDYLAVIESTEKDHSNTFLRIIKADGTKTVTIENTQRLNNKEYFGRFEWFQEPRQSGKGIFGVVFRPHNYPDAFLLEIQAEEAKIISSFQIRV
jgi:hypothetical protein